MSGEESFLARWSRRKRAAEPETAAEDATAPAEEKADPPAAPAPAACPIPDLPEIDLASLPRIEELTAESDFGLFLRPGIPPALRHAALKRMWSLDPAIRDYIGPVEYQWDFNAPDGLPFGFARELAGDVGRLLAQAIGQVESLGDRLPAPDCAAAEDEDAAGPPPPAPPAADAPPASVAALPELEPEAPASDPAASEAPARRRRHGGAMPV